MLEHSLLEFQDVKPLGDQVVAVLGWNALNDLWPIRSDVIDDVNCSVNHDLVLRIDVDDPTLLLGLELPNYRIEETLLVEAAVLDTSCKVDHHV